MRKFYFGFDLGHTEWKVSVLEENPNGEFIAFHQAIKNEALIRGEVVDEQTLCRQLEHVCTNLSESLDRYPIREVGVTVTLPQFHTHLAKGYTFPQANIENEDIDKAVRMAKTSIAMSNQEVLSEFPHQYILDNEQVVRDPRGMNAKRLDVEVLFVTTFRPILEKLRQAFRDVRVTMLSFGPSIMSASQLALSKRERETGTLLLDLGGTTTSAALFQSGSLLDFRVFPFGGQQLTEELAVHLKISPEEAEELKLSLSREEEPRQRKVKGKNLISRAVLSRFLEKQFREAVHETGLVDYVKAARKRRQIMGLSLIGGGALLSPVVDWSKQILSVPAKQAKSELNFFHDHHDALKFYASAGAAYNACRNASATGLLQRLKDLVRTFIG